MLYPGRQHDAVPCTGHGRDVIRDAVKIGEIVVG